MRSEKAEQKENACLWKGRYLCISRHLLWNWARTKAIEGRGKSWKAMCCIEEKAPRSRKGSNLKALFVRGVKANSSPLWLPFVRAILHNVLKPVVTCHSKEGSVFGTMAKAFQYSCPVLILIAYLPCTYETRNLLRIWGTRNTKSLFQNWSLVTCWQVTIMMILNDPGMQMDWRKGSRNSWVPDKIMLLLPVCVYSAAQDLQL